MKNNIVQIKTYKGRGTGILYPCKYTAVEKGYSSYLVFTCAHVLDNQKDNFPSDGGDIMGMVDLGIYDDLGNMVDESDIKEIRYHIPQSLEDSMCDIALFLVQIKSNIRITLETKFYQEELKNRDLLYVEGYPRVMFNDKINQKVQLEGMYKELFPERSMVGMYQIKDDYHWYNDYQDLKLMEGFSGSPVYIEKNGEFYLLGMNQSVANINKGENPFKIVYYLKMYYILDCLRQSDCIIFRTNKNGNVDIEWVLDQNQDGKDINILMLGSSGAGKSSFTKTFAYHGYKLKITNDGQTTRSNVFYQFSLFPEKCSVRVKFFSKKDFVKKMEDKLVIEKWLCFLQEIAGIEGAKSDYTGCAFLKNIYPFFRHLKNLTVIKKEETYNRFREKIKKSAQKIEKSISDVLVENSGRMECSLQEYLKKISDCYDLIIQFLWEYISLTYWKYCFDRNWWEFSSKDSEEEPDDPKLKEILKLSKNEFIWKNYQEKLAEKLFDNITANNIDSKKEFFGEKFKGLCQSLLHIEGFFDQTEINFLLLYHKDELEQIFDSNTDIEKRHRFIYSHNSEEESEKEEDKQKMSIAKRNMDKICKYLYGVLYDYFDDFIEKKELEFDLTKVLTPDEENLMEKCFQSTPKGALTIFVRNIVIEDKISDQYAWIVRRLHIKKLNILDSCGLDHVKNNIDDVSKIRNILTEHMQMKGTAGLGDHYATVYLKKLDSGKPDELRNILPAVVRAIPESPVYCVFTGIDIFYNQNNICTQDLDWNEQNLKNVPKSVKYLLIDSSQSGSEEKEQQIKEKAEMLFKGTGISDIRKRNLYLVLKNNLIPFCGNQELLYRNSDFNEHNQQFIEKLLTSILIDEVGSLEIVDLDDKKIKELDNKETEELVKDIIRMIFDKATVKEWRSIHHMIRRADYNRLSDKRERLGYYSYVANVRLEWFQLFSDAYHDVISTEQVAQKFIQKFPQKERAAVESALMRMGDHYLFGDPKYFNKKELDPNQTDFRKKLQALYPESIEIVLESVENGSQRKNKKASSEDVEKYLKGNTNFLERYDERKDSLDFPKIFLEAFKQQINDDNSIKLEGLIRLNEEFEDAFHNLELLFETKYDDKNLLYIVMREYFKGKAEIH